MHHPTYMITHTMAFVIPVVEHWLEREIAQWVHPMKDRSDDPSHHERTLYLWATSRSQQLLRDGENILPWCTYINIVDLGVVLHVTSPQLIQHFLQLQRLVDPGKALFYWPHDPQRVRLQMWVGFQSLNTLSLKRRKHILNIRVHLKQSGMI